MNTPEAAYVLALPYANVRGVNAFCALLPVWRSLGLIELMTVSSTTQSQQRDIKGQQEGATPPPPPPVGCKLQHKLLLCSMFLSGLSPDTTPPKHGLVAIAVCAMQPYSAITCADTICNCCLLSQPAAEQGNKSFLQAARRATVWRTASCQLSCSLRRGSAAGCCQ